MWTQAENCSGENISLFPSADCPFLLRHLDWLGFQMFPEIWFLLPWPWEAHDFWCEQRVFHRSNSLDFNEHVNHDHNCHGRLISPIFHVYLRGHDQVEPVFSGRNDRVISGTPQAPDQWSTLDPKICCRNPSDFPMFAEIMWTPLRPKAMRRLYLDHPARCALVDFFQGNLHGKWWFNHWKWGISWENSWDLIEH